MTGAVTTGRRADIREGAAIYDLREVSFTYPGGAKRVLKEVSFSLAPGEVMSILGPNGAGKTTLLSLMMGFLKPDGGSITIAGEAVAQMSAKQIAGEVGYVPQVHEPSFDYSVKQFILMGVAPGKGLFQGPSAKDEEQCDRLMEELDIAKLADRSYLQISGGERQQALIARAVMQDPQVILFDEPTAHLDYGNTYRTLKMVRAMAERGFAVVLTTHDPNQALLLGGKAGVIDREGHMTNGTVEEIVTEERLAQVYDCELKLVEIEEMDRIACVTPAL